MSTGLSSKPFSSNKRKAQTRQKRDDICVGARDGKARIPKDGLSEHDDGALKLLKKKELFDTMTLHA